MAMFDEDNKYSGKESRVKHGHMNGHAPENMALRPEELQTEWRRLVQQIGTGSTSTSSDNHEENANTHTISHKRNRSPYSWLAAAAAFLIVGLAGWYLLVPATIDAPHGSFTTYEWSDSIRVELNSGSQISWNRRFGSGHRSLYLQGEAYFEVPSSDKPFVVKTHNAYVKVYGTRFNVRSWENDPDKMTVLTLIDGEVSLASFLRPDDPVMLQPGHWSQIDRHSQIPGSPEPVDTSRALAWREKGFYFASITLDQVSAELERRFNTVIEIENQSLADRTLTLYLPSPDNLENIVETISHITNSRYRWSNEHIVLY